MTTATKAARPRTTHSEHDGAQHSGAQHQGAPDNGVAETDAALARIAEADAALARIAEADAAGGSQTGNVADDIVTGLSLELTMLVRSIVRLAQELFGGVAAEFGSVVGLNVDDDQESDLCIGDPTAWV
jgi:hypothetical protein